MAVPKTTQTVCRDGSVQARQGTYKHYTSNPISTSFFHAQCCFSVILEYSVIRMLHTKKVCVGMGLFV